MAPMFAIYESKANGPGDKPHFGYVELHGNLSAQAARESGARVVRAKSMNEAVKKYPCPACAEGRRIIRESGF